MMIARTLPRQAKAPKAVTEGISEPRHASTLRTPPKKSRFWIKAILLGTLLSICTGYLYWRETSFAPNSPASKQFWNAIDQQKYPEAIEIVRRHAARGNADAQYNLAVMNSHGHGTAVDHKTAYKLYRQAAAKGQPDAIEVVKRIDAEEKEQSRR
jgi:TPR repeat protein